MKKIIAIILTELIIQSCKNKNNNKNTVDNKSTTTNMLSDSAQPIKNKILNNEKISFVLVHGAWHGGWCWNKLTPLLKSKGYNVFAPTLTGLGERSHLLTSKVDLNTHIMDIVNMLEYEDLKGVILVGHSYAGMVISGVLLLVCAYSKKVLPISNCVEKTTQPVSICTKIYKPVCGCNSRT
jgi:esterase/lipase